MTAERDHLARLLRMQLSVVHQQFFHMLALRQWKETELLDRITRVDGEDFRCAMQIADLLVGRGDRVALDGQRIAPGSSPDAILRAELRLEDDFAALFPTLAVETPEAAARLARAEAPRAGYRAWLTERLAAAPPGPDVPRTPEALAGLLAKLLALVEQAMLHAFLHWHGDRRAASDTAWRISGAAMLYGAALVRHCAAQGLVPVPARIAPLAVADTAAEAVAADRKLAGACADAAREAGERLADEELRRLCRRIGEDCALIAGAPSDAPFPARYGRSPVFDSFARTHARHLA